MILQEIAQAVERGKSRQVKELVNQALAEGSRCSGDPCRHRLPLRPADHYHAGYRRRHRGI